MLHKSSIFDIFFENLSFDFPEKKYETRTIMILDFSFLLPCQAKFWGFVLLSKILLTSQIAGFLKVQYFMEEFKHKVNYFKWIEIHRNNQLNLVRHSWVYPKYFKIINQL